MTCIEDSLYQYILRGLVHVRDFFLAFGIHQNGTTRKLDRFLPVFSSIDKAQTKGLVNLPDFLPNFCLMMIKPKFDQNTGITHTPPHAIFGTRLEETFFALKRHIFHQDGRALCRQFTEFTRHLCDGVCVAVAVLGRASPAQTITSSLIIRQTDRMGSHHAR